MPRPSLGRRTLTVRLLPSAIEALGESPSERAREVLERWAKTHRARKRTSEPEEPPPPSSGPAKTKRNEGR